MFRLRKWYLDVVGDDGGAAILYHARLAWGPLRIAYGAALTTDGAGTRERATLRPGGEPHETTDAIAWRCAPLRLHGTWRRQAAPVRQELMPGVTWDCRAPAADTELAIGDRRWRGLGYVEALTMTVPPWRLPFRELRWGRALAAGRSTTWIDWRDGLARRWAVIDGARATLATCADDRLVAADGGALTLGRERVLRDAPLAGTLAAVPGLALLVPRRIRRAQETKWLSRATWSDGASGWAIHEVVRWA